MILSHHLNYGHRIFPPSISCLCLLLSWICSRVSYLSSFEFQANTTLTANSTADCISPGRLYSSFSSYFSWFILYSWSYTSCIYDTQGYWRFTVRSVFLSQKWVLIWSTPLEIGVGYTKIRATEVRDEFLSEAHYLSWNSLLQNPCCCWLKRNHQDGASQRHSDRLLIWGNWVFAVWAFMMKKQMINKRDQNVPQP